MNSIVFKFQINNRKYLFANTHVPLQFKPSKFLLLHIQKNKHFRYRIQLAFFAVFVLYSNSSWLRALFNRTHNHHHQQHDHTPSTCVIPRTSSRSQPLLGGYGLESILTCSSNGHVGFQLHSPRNTHATSRAIRGVESSSSSSRAKQPIFADFSKNAGWRC